MDTLLKIIGVIFLVVAVAIAILPAIANSNDISQIDNNYYYNNNKIDDTIKEYNINHNLYNRLNEIEQLMYLIEYFYSNYSFDRDRLINN